MSDCKHDWVYEPAILCSLPPKQRKTCRKCKKEAVDVLGEYIDHNEYYEIKFQEREDKNEH